MYLWSSTAELSILAFLLICLRCLFSFFSFSVFYLFPQFFCLKISVHLLRWLGLGWCMLGYWQTHGLQYNKKSNKGQNGTRYKTVPKICADVSLVFENAMKYNDERSNVHMMAKTLLEKFEEKWMQLLPKVNEVVVVIPRK